MKLPTFLSKITAGVLSAKTPAGVTTKSSPTEQTRAALRDPIGSRLAALPNAPTYDRQRIEIVESHPIAFWCVRKIAWNTSVVKWVMEDEAGNHVPENDLTYVLNNPNAQQSRADFYQLVAASLAVTGNAYIYMIPAAVNDGQLGAMVFLRPDQVVPQMTSDQMGVEYYSYTSGSGSRRLEVQEVLHIRHPWLSHNVLGLSLATPAWESMSLYSGTSKLARKILENAGGVPGAIVFKSPTGLSDTQRAEMRDTVNQFRVDGEKFGELMLLDVANTDVSFMELAGDLARTQPTETLERTADDICNLYGIPPLLRKQGDGATFANMGEANRMMWLETIIPGYINVIGDAFTRHFGFKIAADLSAVPALSKVNKEVVDVLGAADWLTINEKRAEMGFDPTPMGDRVMSAMGAVPLDTQIAGQDAMVVELHDPKLIQAILEADAATREPATAAEKAQRTQVPLRLVARASK